MASHHGAGAGRRIVALIETERFRALVVAVERGASGTDARAAHRGGGVMETAAEALARLETEATAASVARAREVRELVARVGREAAAFHLACEREERLAGGGVRLLGAGVRS
jgi:hypothetical protein